MKGVWKIRRYLPVCFGMHRGVWEVRGVPYFQ